MNQSNLSPQSIITKPHYPFLTQLLIELYNSGQLPTIKTLDVEPQYGYVGRIVYHNNSIRMFKGWSADINRQSAGHISKDKGYAKYFLEQLGYNVPQGSVFLLDSYLQKIAKNLTYNGFTKPIQAGEILAYINSTVGYPCFIKPNAGSQGKDIYKCVNDDDVQLVVDRYIAKQIDVFLVERNIAYPDYRCVIFNGQMICCYLRKPLALTGDGQTTIGDLLARKQAQFQQQQRTARIRMHDPRIVSTLTKHGYTFESILAQDQQLTIMDISNLSAGGEAEDYTDKIHLYWQNLCSKLTEDMGLNLCGVDIACADLTNPDADYCILEINAAPGLDNYASIGPAQTERVRKLYTTIFNQPK